MARYKNVPSKNDQTEKEKTVDVHVAQNSVRNTVLGCLLTLLSAFMLAIGQGCIQLLDGSVGDFQLLAMRTFGQMCVGASFFIRKRRLPRVERKLWIWLFCFCFCAVGVNLTFGIGIRLIPAGIAACARRCIELITMTALAILVLKELMTIIKAVCVVICLGGVVMLIQPWYEKPVENTFHNVTGLGLVPDNSSFHNSSLPSYNSDLNSTISNLKEEDDENILSEVIWGYTLVGLAGILSATANMLQKYRLLSMNSWTILFYIGFLGFTVTGTISLATEKLTFPTEVKGIVYITIQSLMWGGSALTRLKSVSLAPALLVTMVMSMQIVFLLIGQYTILSQVHPGIGNWVEIAGAVLVIIATLTPPGWEILKSHLSKETKKDPTPSGGTCNEAEAIPLEKVENRV